MDAEAKDLWKKKWRLFKRWLKKKWKLFKPGLEKLGELLLSILRWFYAHIAHFMIVGGIILGVYTAFWAFNGIPERHHHTLNPTHSGAAAFALLTAGALLIRAQAADETAKASDRTINVQIQEEKSRRLAQAVELMSAMKKDKKPDKEGREYPDVLKQMGGILILEQLMKEKEARYLKIGLDYLHSFVYSAAPSIDRDLETRKPGTGFPLIAIGKDRVVIGDSVKAAVHILVHNRKKFPLFLNFLFLQGLDLEGANLSQAYFIGSYLGHSYLRKVDFRSAQLFGTDFRSAQLFGTDFRSADLRMASFSDAHLIDPNDINNQESYAKLARAKISGCNFSDAWVQKEQLLSAKFDTIICPDGIKRTEKGVKDEDWEKMLIGVGSRQVVKTEERQKAKKPKP